MGEKSVVTDFIRIYVLGPNLLLITKIDSNLKKYVQFFGYWVKMDKKHGILTNLRGIYVAKIQIHSKIDKN